MIPTEPGQFDPPPEVLFSMNALRRAWRLVRRNGASPGTDGVTQEQFEENLDLELNRLRQHILGGTYQPQPVRRFYVKKASGKQRPISIWSMRDRVAQRVVHDYMTPLLESLFLDCSYGFRPGRSVEQAVQAVIRARDIGLVWVLDTDIGDCFGSIHLDLLMAQLRRVVPSPFVLKLIELWLYTPVGGRQSRETAGVSQGGVISPQLANLYLHRFDEMVIAALPQACLVRFADDFVILCRSEQEAAWSLDVARRSLENLRLTLNMRKTRIVHLDEGFTFLGFTFKGRWHQAAVPQQNKEER
jgi:group II intron reverse transcriptase/maturase